MYLLSRLCAPGTRSKPCTTRSKNTPRAIAKASGAAVSSFFLSDATLSCRLSSSGTRARKPTDCCMLRYKTHMQGNTRSHLFHSNKLQPRYEAISKFLAEAGFDSSSFDYKVEEARLLTRMLGGGLFGTGVAVSPSPPFC